MNKREEQRLLKEKERLLKERLRLKEMRIYEEEYGMYQNICGIDEAGRGPLAGPVVAGAVILGEDTEIFYLNDSKKLSAKKREELYDEIMEKAVSVGVGIVSPERIDEINILQATYEAMREAVGKLKAKPDILLNDAVVVPGIDIKQVPIVKGDAKSRTCSGKYCCKGHEGPNDGGVRGYLCRIRLCKAQRIRDKGAY